MTGPIEQRLGQCRPLPAMLKALKGLGTRPGGQHRPARVGWPVEGDLLRTGRQPGRGFRLEGAQMRHTHGGDAGTGEDRVDLPAWPDLFLGAEPPSTTVGRIGGGWKWAIAAFTADDRDAHSDVAGLKRWRHAHQRGLTAAERTPVHECQL